MKAKIARKLIMSLILVVALVGFSMLNVGAIPIEGDINFGGGTTFNTTNFTGFNLIEVTSGSGTYGSIPTGSTSIPSVTFNPFQYNPPAPPVTPLWTFSYLGLTYSFNATSMINVPEPPGIVVVMGTGTASVTGFTDTTGAWNISANKFTGSTLGSFSASTVVPEPATMLLLGSGLLGMGVYARRRFIKK